MLQQALYRIQRPRPVFVGQVGGAQTAQAVVFMNITEEELSLDLEGRNGVAARRAITPGGTFDLKKVVRLDSRETTYSVIAKDKTSAALAIEGSVSGGRYYHREMVRAPLGGLEPSRRP